MCCKLENIISARPWDAASLHGREEVVKLLLDNGAEVDRARTDSGVTPLHAASQMGHLGVVEALLGKGGAWQTSLTTFFNAFANGCRST